MKKLIFCGVCALLAFQLYSQSYGILEFNNIKARINNDGNLFNDTDNQEASFEVPKGTDYHSMYIANLWFDGKGQSSNNIMNSASQYNASEVFSPGPIADSYDMAYNEKYSRVWLISKEMVEMHLQQWGSPDYIMPEVIVSWPANGNVANGEAGQLAPYADRNQNGIYEPELGEYPCIEGDQAVYIIYNDMNNRDTSKHGPGMGLEIHLLAYEYGSNNEVNNTLYLKYDIYNRSLETYDEFRPGIYADIDIGCGSDDYVGCDTANQTIYAYNGDSYDEDCFNSLGYKANPPAVGFTFLNQTLDGFMTFRSGTGSTGDPFTTADHNNYMNMRWKDGTSITHGDAGYGGNTPTKYMYSGDPNDTTQWNEGFNPPSDRKILGVISSRTFEPEQVLTMELAVNFSIGLNTSKIYPSVASYLGQQNVVKDHWVNNMNNCDQFVGINEEEKDNLMLYPNPADQKLNISAKNLKDKRIDLIRIFNSLGKEVHLKKNIQNTEIDISHLKNGIYFVTIQISEGNSINSKLVIKH